MVFVEIRTVMMLSSSHTTSTGMLAMLSYTAVAGGDVTAAVYMVLVDWQTQRLGGSEVGRFSWPDMDVTYCLRVLLNRVGIAATGGCRC